MDRPTWRPSWAVQARALTTRPRPSAPPQPPPAPPSPKPQKALKKHATPAKARCFREEAEPILSEAGTQIGWRCLGCRTPFGMWAGAVRKKFRAAPPAQDLTPT